MSPKATIVVGGNLAASAEILLRKIEIDFCVIGYGELVIQALIKALGNNTSSDDELKKIFGICFLDKEGKFYFTGYSTQPSAEDVEWPDYSIFEKDGSLNHYIQDIPSWIQDFGLQVTKEMVGKKSAIIQIAKGCVNRCTFCHRWGKGYQVRPVDKIIEHIRFLKDKYNVGILDLSDESFGTNKNFTKELVAKLGKLGMVWRVGAARAKSVDPETLKFWKANGCVMVIYGIEAGSQSILNVMEKNAKVENNVEAIKWTYEANMTTVVQLVIAMPGETDETIQETVDFLKKSISYYPTAFRRKMVVVQSINYAQALPGTPLYEYAREKGFIGKDVEDEEKYLIKISDSNASETKEFLNLTQQPLLKVLLWRYIITGKVNAHYMRTIHKAELSFSAIFGDFALRSLQLARVKILLKIRKTHVFSKNTLDNEKKMDVPSAGIHWASKGFSKSLPVDVILFLNSNFRRLFFPLFVCAVSIKKTDSIFRSLALIWEYIFWGMTGLFRPPLNLPSKSLRKIVVMESSQNSDGESEMMKPLRRGR